MRRLRTAFIFNLKNSAADAETCLEWDAPETVAAVSAALSECSDVIEIDADGATAEKILESAPDAAFNYAEGLEGEGREAEIPELLESINLPYTGSGPETMVNCLNKAKTKEILKTSGIPTAPYRIIHPGGGADFSGLEFPLIIKPLWEGSSKGIHDDCIAKTPAEARKLASEISEKFSQPALAEAFLPGREFTVGIIGNGPGALILPPAEINHGALIEKNLNPVLSYEAKWVADTPENPLPVLVCPADAGEPLEKKLRDISLRAFLALACRDWCRVDIRLDAKGEPNILELNPVPGLLPRPEDNSCLPAAARAAGISYRELINMVLESALKRLGAEGAL